MSSEINILLLILLNLSLTGDRYRPKAPVEFVGNASDNACESLVLVIVQKSRRSCNIQNDHLPAAQEAPLKIRQTYWARTVAPPQ